MTTLKTRNKRFSHIALALALSAGTVGGMMAIATLSEPALAQGKGGGNAGAGGGENGDVMKATKEPYARRRGTPNERLPPARPENCGGSQYSYGGSLQNCRYTEMRYYRIL